MATPTPQEVSERLRHGILPLARQQLDGVNRDHGGVATNAIAIFAIDVAALAGIVVWDDSHHYPDHWLVPYFGILLSVLLAIWTLLPMARWKEDEHKTLRKIPVVQLLAAGFSQDAGPDVLSLLDRIATEPDPSAYSTILATLVRARERTTASLALRSYLITAAIVLLPVDALTSWIYFRVW